MGEVFTHDIHYAPADQARTLHVYLPDGYEGSDERYPVMYWFDGHNLFFDDRATFGRSWGLKDFLDGWEKKLIVVGMECSHEGDARLDEYCPYAGGRIVGHTSAGMGEQTFRWIAEVVKPWADENLRTWPHREATGIAGSSMGGLMSLYGVLAHNDLFSKAACLSTGVRFWAENLRRTLATSSVDPDTRIYLAWGELEQGHLRKGADPTTESPEARATRAFAHHVRRTGADSCLYFQEGGAHSEESWGQQNERFLSYLWLDRRW